MLLELRRKKAEVLEEKLDMILPKELIPFVEENFRTAFESEVSEKRILPFLDIEESIVPFRVQLEVRFHHESGVQNIIHFFKNEDLKSNPIFLYCADTDRIISSSDQFDYLIKSYDRKL